MKLKELATTLNDVISDWNRKIQMAQSREAAMLLLVESVDELRAQVRDLVEDGSYTPTELSPPPQELTDFWDIPAPEEGKYLGTTEWHRRFVWKLPKSVTKISDLFGGPYSHEMKEGNVLVAISPSAVRGKSPREFATMWHQTQVVPANGLDSPSSTLLTNSVWLIDIHPSVTAYEFKLRPTRDGDRILLIVTETSPMSGAIYLTAGTGLTFNFGLDDPYDGGARRPLFGGMTYSLLFSETHSTWLVEEVGET